MLPLRPEDLVVGNLYKGIWLTAITNEAMSDILLTNDSFPAGQMMASMDCFVLLDKDQCQSEMTWKLTILTRNGEFGCTYLSTGTHWFKEITEVDK